jgi:hypothetical protein
MTTRTITGVNVKFIRCDDSGEKMALFEKKSFGRIRAMFSSAGLKDLIRSGVWAECAKTVTFSLILRQSRIKRSVLINCYLDASQDHQQV